MVAYFTAGAWTSILMAKAPKIKGELNLDWNK